MTTIYRDLVDVGGFIFNTPTPIYYDFRIDEMAGWFDGPEVDAVISEFGVADGGSPGFFPAKSKYVYVQGYVLFQSRAEGEQVKTIIGTAFPRNTDIEVIRHSPTPTKMTMRRAGRIEFPQDLPEGIRFVVPLVATDPFRYSINDATISIGISTPDESGRVYPRTYPLEYLGVVGGGGNLGENFQNVGNANSYPVSVINGPLSAGGWQLINETTGQRLTFNVSLTETQFLEIDHGSHTLKMNGYPYIAPAEGDWWPLIPGNNFIRLTSSDFNATAELVLHPSSAWE
jgi:hypothetical protein